MPPKEKWKSIGLPEEILDGFKKQYTIQYRKWDSWRDALENLAEELYAKNLEEGLENE